MDAGLMKALPNLDPTLLKEEAGAYVTADGHFHVVRREARQWRIRATSTHALVVKDAAGIHGPYPTLAIAMENLLGSVYAEPHGWAHHVQEAFDLDRERVYAR